VHLAAKLYCGSGNPNSIIASLRQFRELQQHFMKAVVLNFTSFPKLS
jgi:hypothetical protein